MLKTEHAYVVLLNILIIFNDCPSFVYTIIHIKFYRLKFHGGVSLMTSTKRYNYYIIVLAMILTH